MTLKSTLIHRDTLARWIGPIGLCLFGALLAAWIWQHSGELLLDFGRELYVSWQLSQGKVLYRDIDYRFGPLAAYANALWMALFGPGLRTIRVANLVVLTAVTILLYHLVLKMADRFTAGVATAFFLLLFGLTTGTFAFQYNFLTPYNHGATYGFLLSLAALTCVGRFCRTRQLREASAAGFFTGLCFLTKPEIFVGCASAVFAAIVAAIILLKLPKGRTLAAAVSAFIVPIAVAFIALSVAMPCRTALSGTLGGFQYMGNREIVENPFYRWCMGTDFLQRNATAMLKSAGFYVVLILTLATGAFALRKRQSLVRICSAFVGVLIAMILLLDQHLRVVLRSLIDPGLPIAMAACGVIFSMRLKKVRLHPDVAEAQISKWSFAVFAFILLLKMFFNARISHYGFVLAAPAAMLAAVMLLYEFPAVLNHAGMSGKFFRISALGLLAGIAGHRLIVTREAMRHDTAPLVLGGTLPMPHNDMAALQVMHYFSKKVPGDTSLVVFPDDAGLNYACAKSSSIPFTVFNPFELKMTGEQTIRQALAAAPPDFIAIVDTDESEYGLRTFGLDFGVSIAQWIDARYEVAARYPEPAGTEQMIRKIILLRRKHVTFDARTLVR